MARYLSELFLERPTQFGLRGDKYFWDYLEMFFSKIEFPYLEKSLTEDIYQIFYNVCGEHLRTDVRPYVEEFSHGGMSSGQLSGEFWIDKGIPLIISRYRKIMLESGLEREI